MPKASFLKKDAYSPGAGFAEGWGEIEGAIARYAQWQNVANPLTVVVLTIQRYDNDFKQKIGPVEETELIVEFGPKDGSLIQVRPGNADSRDGEAGDTLNSSGNMELGTEGNCLFVEEGHKIRGDNPWIIFCESLRDPCGFKPEILGAGYLPDLIGTRAHLKMVPGRKYNKADGTEKQPENLVADKIVQFPYEKSAGVKGGGKSTAGKAAAAPASAGKPANGAPASSSDLEEACIASIKEFAAESGPITAAQNKIVVGAAQKLLPKIDKKRAKEAVDMLKDPVWFLANAEKFGASDAGDGNWMLLG